MLKVLVFGGLLGVGFAAENVGDLSIVGGIVSIALAVIGLEAWWIRDLRSENRQLVDKVLTLADRSRELGNTATQVVRDELARERDASSRADLVDLVNKVNERLDREARNGPS